MPFPRYWLMKIEPAELDIDALAALPGQCVGWYGVRNYQARNFMRDGMRLGDLALYYYSSCAEPGIAGIVQVCSTAYPDPTQFDPAHRYYDPKATEAQPRWFQVDVRFVRKTPFLPLATLRTTAELEGLRILARGNRLSITPVSAGHWAIIQQMMGL